MSLKICFWYVIFPFKNKLLPGYFIIAMFLVCHFPVTEKLHFRYVIKEMFLVCHGPSTKKVSFWYFIIGMFLVFHFPFTKKLPFWYVIKAMFLVCPLSLQYFRYFFGMSWSYVFGMSSFRGRISTFLVCLQGMFLVCFVKWHT